MLLRILCTLLVAGAILLITGCLFPNVRLAKVHAVPIGDIDVIEGLGFTSSVETTGMDQEQLIMRVRLRNAAGDALRSRDGKFQSADGDVECARTLMVFGNQWTNDVKLDIPANQVE